MVTADASSAAQHLGLGHVSGLRGRDDPRLRLFLSSPIRMGGRGVYKSISVGHQENKDQESNHRKRQIQQTARVTWHAEKEAGRGKS